ncbi:MAG: hypothetical protein IT229_11940 [Flavobacteriales bacterium]|nr:hypothetical protein [Flavobacteriales bacterium]
MERREHYDPEDIEQLLMERSYDELLEEERAYVLRHLSGREEYEAMRKLLDHVQRSEPEPDLLDADPSVRAHVMQVFRDQRKPQWRVWLNSVGALLMPEDASAMWRPALALAGLAAVITTGVWLFRSGDKAPDQLADLQKVEQAEPNKPIAPIGNEPSVDAPAPTTKNELAAQHEQLQNTVNDAQGTLLEERRESPATGSAMEEVDDVVVASAEPAADEEVVYARKDVAASADRMRNADTVQFEDAVKFTQAAPTATNSGYVNNWSLANADGTVARQTAVAKEKKMEERRAKAGSDRERASSRSLAEDPMAIALLSAAW